MADIPVSRRRLESALSRYASGIRRAFMQAVQSVKDQARVGAITRAIEQGNISRAVDLVGADETALRPVERAMREAFEGGGNLTIGGMPQLRDPDGVRILLRFDPGSPRAERWIREHSSDFITRTTLDQRNALRFVMEDGVSQGHNPRRTALDVVGRIDRQTGRRAGGIVGLTEQQARFVTNARRELADPEIMRQFLDRQARDRRFDRMILNALEDGRPLNQAEINRIIQRYENSLLSVRGDTIARTEGTGAFNAGRSEAMEQTLDEADVDRQAVRKTWRAVGDARTRDRHAALNGETVGIDERFSNGLKHPGDPSGFPEQIANCRCTMTYEIGQNAQRQAA